MYLKAGLISSRKELSQQSEILNSENDRTILNQIKDDTTSMSVLVDASSDASFRQRLFSTCRSSVVTTALDFDGELPSHELYQKAFRTLLKRGSHPAARGNQPTSSRGI